MVWQQSTSNQRVLLYEYESVLYVDNNIHLWWAFCTCTSARNQFWIVLVIAVAASHRNFHQKRNRFAGFHLSNLLCETINWQMIQFTVSVKSMCIRQPPTSTQVLYRQQNFTRFLRHCILTRPPSAHSHSPNLNVSHVKVIENRLFFRAKRRGAFIFRRRR